MEVHAIWKYMLRECYTFIVAISMVMFQCQGICIVVPVSDDFERKEGDCFLSLAKISEYVSVNQTIVRVQT